MKANFLFKSAVYLLLFVALLGNSCTVTKRVHRKGWHISWNKNYKSDNSDNDETADKGNLHRTEAKEDKNSIAFKPTNSEENQTEDKRSSFKSENRTEEISTDDGIESSTDEIEEHAPVDELPNTESNETHDVKEIPLGGPYFFMGLFTAIGVGLLALSAFEFAIGAFLVAIAALIIVGHVKNIQHGNNKKSHIRPSGFYNSIIFMVLCAVILAYIIIYGGLGSPLGIVISAVLLLLIGLLIFLINQTKDLHYKEVQKKQKEKEAAQKKEEKEATPEEKKKTRTAGLIVGALVVALFLTIALLNN